MNFTGRPWIDWPIAVAAALAAYLTLWKRGLKPLLDGLSHLGDIASTLGGIAAEFRPNGGSLKEVVIRIERKTDEAVDKAGKAVVIAKATEAKVDEAATKIGEIKDAQAPPTEPPQGPSR